MEKGNCVQVALAVAFLSGCMGCGAKSMAPEPAPAAAKAAASTERSEELEGELRLQREPVRNERARRLMALVVPLQSAVAACSSTRITEQVLLTAAHCVAAQVELTAASATLTEMHMACLHSEDGSCGAPVGDTLEDVPGDLATLQLPYATSLPETPRLGAIGGDLPEVYMLSARQGEPRAICRATGAVMIGSTDPIELGDSGSSLVAIDHLDTAWIVGVVSQHTLADRELRAAKLPARLPWRAEWGATPAVDRAEAASFLPIGECR